MKLCWLTDLHLNFISEVDIIKFINSLEPVSGAVITGDIAESLSIKRLLLCFKKHFNKPIYFVLGNHDYYGSYIKDVDNEMSKIHLDNDLHWLRNAVHLSDDVGMVGTEGWYDGHYGNGINSKVRMLDWEIVLDINDRIVEIINNGEGNILGVLRKIARQMSNHLERALNNLGEKRTIVIATHVPPYKNAAVHNGKISNDDWLPWFSSKMTGSVIDEYAKKYPNTKFIVLCGHTHSSGVYNRAKNVIVYTGAARYGDLNKSVAGHLYVEDMFLSPTLEI